MNWGWGWGVEGNRTDINQEGKDVSQSGLMMYGNQYASMERYEANTQVCTNTRKSLYWLNTYKLLSSYYYLLRDTAKSTSV